MQNELSADATDNRIFRPMRRRFPVGLRFSIRLLLLATLLIALYFGHSTYLARQQRSAVTALMLNGVGICYDYEWRTLGRRSWSIGFADGDYFQQVSTVSLGVGQVEMALPYLARLPFLSEVRLSGGDGVEQAREKVLATLPRVKIVLDPLRFTSTASNEVGALHHREVATKIVPGLVGLLNNSSTQERIYAAHRLGYYVDCSHDAVVGLVRIASHDEAVEVRSCGAKALEFAEAPLAIAEAARLMEDENSDIRRLATLGLCAHAVGDERAYEALVLRGLCSADQRVKELARQEIMKRDDSDANRRILERAIERGGEAGNQASQILSAWDARKGVLPTERSVSDPFLDPQVRLAQ